MTAGGRRVCVTGAMGFLGSAVVRQLVAAGAAVRALVRREVAPWERVPGAEYVVSDLGDPLEAGGSALRGCEVVVHCAAETRSGWTAHQRNSIDATRHLITAAAAAGVTRIVHVSSLAVLAHAAPRAGVAPDESAPLAPNPRERGPYVWGKLESERLAVQLGAELGVQVKIARPGAIVDTRHFDPPGRLGKRLGPWFVAVGSPRDRVAVVERDLAARTLAWLALHFEDAPCTLHLVSPTVPTKRALVTQLRRTNPDLMLVWLPRLVLLPLAWLAVAVQKVLHPRRPATNPASAFDAQEVDTARIQALASIVLGQAALATPATGEFSARRPRPPVHQGSSLAPQTAEE